MRTKIVMLSLLFIMMIGALILPGKASAQVGVSVSFQVFYDELSPYGTWVDTPDYGYVWVPDVAPGFEPYSTNGYWIFTDQGWTWVSDYSWGWAPFHYGRWYMDPYYGATWVPDNEWGPGWVTWRRSGEFYGWAPIGPGVSISRAYGNGYYVPNNQWTFVRNRDFGRTNIHRYYVDNSYNVTIINNSTVINNTRVDRSRHVTYHAGPERAEVERRSGRNYTPVTIKESNKPGQTISRNQLQIYRPQVQRNISNGSKPAPVKVERSENLKQSTDPPARQQQQHPSKQERQAQPANQQQQPRQQPQAKPTKQQQLPRQQPQAQPAKQQQQHPPKQQPQAKPPRQQQPHQQDNPSKNTEKEKESQQSKPPKNLEE